MVVRAGNTRRERASMGDSERDATQLVSRDATRRSPDLESNLFLEHVGWRSEGSGASASCAMSQGTLSEDIWDSSWPWIIEQVVAFKHLTSASPSQLSLTSRRPAKSESSTPKTQLCGTSTSSYSSWKVRWAMADAFLRPGTWNRRRRWGNPSDRVRTKYHRMEANHWCLTTSIARRMDG